MMLERLATAALVLAVICGGLLAINLLMELYDRVLERFVLRDVDKSLPEPEGFEDFWDMVQQEWDFEGEALPPGGAA